MQIDRLMPLREAIAMAGMRTTKAYQEMASGRLAVVRNGRRAFVRMTKLQRYIDPLDCVNPIFRIAKMSENIKSCFWRSSISSGLESTLGPTAILGSSKAR